MMPIYNKLLDILAILLVILSAGVCYGFGKEDLSNAAMQYESDIEELLSIEEVPTESNALARKTFKRFDRTIRELVKIEETDTALNLAKKCRRLYPDQLRTGLLLGWVQGARGELDEAIQITQASLSDKTDPLRDSQDIHRAEALTHLGGFLIQQEKYGQSLPYLEEALTRNKNSAIALYLVGLAHFEEENWYESAKAFSKAVRKDRRLASPDDFQSYAIASEKMGRPDRAQKVLRLAIETFPMEPGFRYNLGQYLELESATREAYYEYRLETLVAGGESPFTREALERIARIETIQLHTDYPDKVLLPLISAPLFKSQGKKEEERKLLEKAVGSTRLDHPYLVYVWASCLLEQDQPGEAIEVLEKAVKEHPGLVLLEADLAAAYSEVGEKEKSEALIRKVLLEAPNHWKAWERFGPLVNNR